ncbi:hypothetical protein NMY22_g15174 [Coprinellus aureogranulatus]|nr:hypothetical protein NMY22_g15174 [Coprinellus aureogranulatus]
MDDVSLPPSHPSLPSSSHPHPHLNSNNPSNSHPHKRTAEAAFSPPSASFGLPSKRPSSMQLTIPDTTFASSSSSSSSMTTTSTATTASSGTGPASGYEGYENSPLEGLSDFSRMSIVEGSPEKRQRHEQYASSQPPSSVQQQQQSQQPTTVQQQPVVHQQQMVATTLVAPYSYRMDARGQAKPQELYFYTLASSPMEPPAPPRSRNSRRRGVSNASELAPSESNNNEDESMVEDEDEIVEMDREEWERERDAHGERRRTRKARLMRTQTSTSSTAQGLGAQPGAYAYDFNRSLNSYRQSHQYAHAPPQVNGVYPHHHPHHQHAPHAPSQPASAVAPSSLPPLVHPLRSPQPNHLWEVATKHLVRLTNTPQQIMVLALLESIYTSPSFTYPRSHIPHILISLLLIYVLRTLSQGRKTSRDRDLHARTVLLTGAFDSALGVTLLVELAGRGASVVCLTGRDVGSAVGVSGNGGGVKSRDDEAKKRDEEEQKHPYADPEPNPDAIDSLLTHDTTSDPSVYGDPHIHTLITLVRGR